MSPRHQLVHIVQPGGAGGAGCGIILCILPRLKMQGESTSSRYWTSIDYTSDNDDEGYVRVLPGQSVKKYTIDQIKPLEQIREGGQGIIYTARLDKLTARDEPEGDMVVKVYKGRRFGEWPACVFGNPLEMRYICNFYGYCLEGDSFYLVMAKYDGSLRDVLDKQMKKQKFKGRHLPDMVALQMMWMIASGMCSLHDYNIIHRDLKADNVFVDTSSSGIPVMAHIGDFDVASYVVGTSFWRAPEVLQALKDGKRPVFTKKTYEYSYAMNCYEILTGGVPPEGVGISNYDGVLVDGKRPKLPSDLHAKLADLLRRCWYQNPKARPTLMEIAEEVGQLHREMEIELESNCNDGIFRHVN